MAGTSEHDRSLVRQAHTRFVLQYRFPTQHAPPLLVGAPPGEPLPSLSFLPPERKSLRVASPSLFPAAALDYVAAQVHEL